MKKLKKIAAAAGVLLFILSAAFLYLGLKGIAAIRPASDYTDKGVHTFSPQRILPVQVENTGTGRMQRNNPTKTVYIVLYRAKDKSGYQWKRDVGSAQSSAKQLLSES